MTTNNSISYLGSKLWSSISSRRRHQFLLLTILMFVSSFAELLSIGAVFPFLSVLTFPSYVYNNPLAKPLFEFLNISSSNQLLLPITILFIGAILISSFIRLLLLWATTRLSFGIGAELSLNIYRKTIYQPYEVHLSRNSSEIIDGITSKTNNIIYFFILPSMNLISNVFFIIFILIVITYINPFISLISLSFLTFMYIFVIKHTKEKILEDGKKVAVESTRLIKSLQESLGSIRELLIDNSQIAYIKNYTTIDKLLRSSQARATFLSQSPRFIIESISMILLTLVAYNLSKQANEISSIIPILGGFTLVAQRILPILNQSFQSWTYIRNMQPTLEQLVILLDQKVPKNYECKVKSIPFNKLIRFNNISFRYASSDIFAVNQFNLEIHKGQKIGLIGETGSGKSTIVDILMGLLDPISGNLEVDGLKITKENKIGWQINIAHVPQSIFLIDSSIAENIALGISSSEIDFTRVKLAAEKAKISELIESLPNKYNTLVGERGAKLSGGQRQRIGIARALYKGSDIIILDEATSALDPTTEESLMVSLNELSNNVTIIMIAHRLSTLKNCDMILQISDGEISKIGTFEDFNN